MNESERHQMDRLLDLLADEVAERLSARSQPRDAGPVDQPTEGVAAGSEPEEGAADEAELPPGLQDESVSSPAPEASQKPEREASAEPESELEGSDETGPRQVGEPTLRSQAEVPAEASVRSHTARLLGRMALGLLLVLVLINIPINRHGTTLATAMPDNRALVIRDGLVVKEQDDPEIYVYRNGEFRWISSLDAFQYLGYTWEDVHIVEDGFLDDYPIGSPLHVLLKCHGSPHIYRVEEEKKRWIVDIEAFEAAGHTWEDVHFISCEYLRNLPNGETIPPGHGPPPEP